jgi:hypothetical protein
VETGVGCQGLGCSCFGDALKVRYSPLFRAFVGDEIFLNFFNRIGRGNAFPRCYFSFLTLTNFLSQSLLCSHGHG